MFEILKDSEANVKDLTAAYLQAMKFEEILKTEQTEVKKDLVSSQLDCLQKKPSKVFLSAKEQLGNISTKIEAVRFGREELKTKIADRLGVEAKQRLEQIKEELELVASEEKELQASFLSMAAKAAVLRESIQGQALSHDTRGNYQVTTPSLEVKLHLMDLEDGKIYSDRVEHYRKELQVGSFGGTIRGRRDDLVGERDQLERLLSGDPLQNAQGLLDKLIPPASEAEKMAEPPKSHPSYESKAFVRDYGNGQGPDYEDGPPLPYRSVGEIVAERK